MKPLVLGTDAVGRRLTLSPEEREAHMHVIGSSGSGKSKFLEWMIRQDLRNRQGFCLIDPHGTLYRDVLEYCGHHALNREIVLLNLSDATHVLGFNPFRRMADGDVSVQVDRRIGATMHAWGVGNGDETPTLERTLRLIYTLLVEQNLSFETAQYLIDFNAHDIREELIAKLESPLIRKEWTELQQLKAKDWRAEVLSAKNRLFRLLTSTTLAKFFSASVEAVDISEIIDQGKVLLVNLAPSDRLSAENARVFGALLVNEFFEVARRRTGRALSPFYLYLDEFQTFVSLDITAMLDQVRKYKLFTVLAHQRFGQLDEDLVDAVLTNCRIKAVFGGLPYESAKLMAQELFIGELDPKKIKAAIYQTKFWPTYSRDKVYSSSHSKGQSTGSGDNVATSVATGASSGEFFMPGEWFSAGGVAGTSMSETTMTSEVSGHHTSYTEFEGESEGEADIPVFVPVPFTELSSVQFYSTEEQLTELTAALKEQFPRHCFVKIHHEKTQPLLVPFLKQFYTSPKNMAWYERKVLAASRALPAAEVILDAGNTPPKAIQSQVESQTSSAKPVRAPWEDLLGRE